MSVAEANLKDARDQLNTILSFFPRVDAKLSTLLALDTAMLAAMSASAPSLSDFHWWMVPAPAATLGFLTTSFIFLYRGGFPNVKGGHASIVYFQEIAKRTEAKFIAEYTALTQDALRGEVLAQVWRNSEILADKFRYLKWAFICMAWGAIPWFISLFLFALGKSTLKGVVHQ